MRRAVQLLSCVLLLVSVRTVEAQSIGPDIIVSAINGEQNYSGPGTTDEFAFGTAACNRGSVPVAFAAATPQHPVMIQNLYRLENGRLEQIGMSWAKHESSALALAGVCGTCIDPGSVALLGQGCTTNSSASANGTSAVLRPRSIINASTGAFLFPFPPAPGGGNSGRLKAAATDIVPILHPSALYFIETQYLAADDAAAGNTKNNVSYRPVSFSLVGPTSIDATLIGTTTIERSALDAWRVADPAVVLQTIDIAGDGRFEVAFRITPTGGGNVHVDVAVRNHDSHLSARALTVHFPSAASVSNISFHDVHYHSGEVISGTDWTTSSTPTSLRFETPTFAVNQNANALRFGTTYTFSFDSSVSPLHGVLDMFRPGGPSSIGFSFCSTTGPSAVAAPFTLDFDALIAPSTLIPCAGGSILGPAFEIESSDPAARARLLDTSDPALPLGIAQPSGMNGPIALVLDRDGPGPAATNTIAVHIDGLASNAAGFGFMIRLLLRDLDDDADLEDVIALTDGVTPGAAVLANGMASPAMGHGGFKETLLEDWNAVQLGNAWREFQYVIDAGFLSSRGLTMSNDMRLIIRQRGAGSAPNDGLAIDAIRIDPILSRTFPATETFDAVTWNGVGPGTTTPPDGWIQSSTDASGADADWYFRNTPDPLDPTGPQADATTGIAGAGSWGCAGNFVGGLTTRSITSDLIDVNPNSTSQTLSLDIYNNTSTSAGQIFVHLDIIGFGCPGEVELCDVRPAIGHQGAFWKPITTLDLSPMLVGITQIRVRVRATNNSVIAGNQKVCIDNVMFAQSGFGGGKRGDPDGSEEVGENTVDVNGFSVDQFVPGPYFATQNAGDPFEIRLNGQPFQPAALLFSAALGPPILTFGPDLQIDLALPLSIIADGFSGIGLLGSNMITSANGEIVLMVPAGATAPLSGVSIATQSVIGGAGYPFGVLTTNAVLLTIM